MPSAMAGAIRAAVDTGAYASTSEVVREALRDWHAKEDSDRRALNSLREMIAEGDIGEDVAAADVFIELDAIVAAALAGRG